jgi:hypothetical protein
MTLKDLRAAGGGKNSSVAACGGQQRGRQEPRKKGTHSRLLACTPMFVKLESPLLYQ